MILGGVNADTGMAVSPPGCCAIACSSPRRDGSNHGSARRWMPPTIVYSAALCVVGLPFVIMRPGALRWAPLFVVRWPGCHSSPHGCAGSARCGQRRPKPMIAGVTEAMCLLLVFIAVIIICPHLA